MVDVKCSSNFVYNLPPSFSSSVAKAGSYTTNLRSKTDTFEASDSKDSKERATLKDWCLWGAFWVLYGVQRLIDGKFDEVKTKELEPI